VTLHYFLRGCLNSKYEQAAATARRQLPVAVAACDLLADISAGRLTGLARLWKAETLLLYDEPDLARVEPAARAALDVLDDPDARAAADAILQAIGRA
jgi:hypothetical protein